MFVIVNKNSGGGTALKKWERFCQELKLDNKSTDTFYVDVNGSIDEFLFEALNKGITNIVIAGGDGSINYSLNHLINLADPEWIRDITIGSVGLGSSNDFHKPHQSENIIDKIPYKLNFSDADFRDVGCISFENDGQFQKKYFLINASVGVVAEGNKFFNNPDFILKLLKKFSTQSAITYAAIKNIFTYGNFDVVISSDKESFKTRLTNIGIIKCPFFSGKLKYPSEPKVDNELFDIHLYQSLTKLKLINLFYTLSKGNSDISFNKKFWRTDRIVISSKTEFTVEFDGEVIQTKAAEFSIIPRLIKVCMN